MPVLLIQLDGKLSVLNTSTEVGPSGRTIGADTCELGTGQITQLLGPGHMNPGSKLQLVKARRSDGAGQCGSLAKVVPVTKLLPSTLSRCVADAATVMLACHTVLEEAGTEVNIPMPEPATPLYSMPAEFTLPTAVPKRTYTYAALDI